MKSKIIIFSLGVILLITLTTEKKVLWCKKIIASTQAASEQNKEEYFKKLSIKYYGTPIFWQELSKINLFAADLNHEDMIVPSYNSIQRYKLNQSNFLASSLINDIE